MNPATAIAAITGKGGVGKTALTAALARIFIESNQGKKLLLIDADPAQGLSYLMGVSGELKTIGGIRDTIIQSAREKGKDAREEIADQFHYLVTEALVEREAFGLLAMGAHHSRGCFCPLNHLLRQAIESLSGYFDLVLIDAEAGIEQINREVVRGIDTLLAVIDSSQRSVLVAGKIRSTLNSLGIDCHMGAAANRAQGDGNDLAESLRAEGIELWGTIEEDPLLRENDRQGKSIFDLPPGANLLEGARRIMPGMLGHLKE